MSTRSCPLCGHTILKVARFCGACGQRVPEETAFVAPPVSVMEASPDLLSLSPADDYNDFTRPNWQPDPQTLAAASGLDAEYTPLGPPVDLDNTLSDVNARGRALAMMDRSSVVPMLSPIGEPMQPAPALAPAAPQPPQPVPQPAPQPAALVAPPPAAWAPPAAPAEPIAPPLAVQAEPALPGRQRTMLGVAMPGIAPPAPAPEPRTRNALGTLLGVATPQLAPPAAAAAPPPPAPGGRVPAHGTLLGIAGPPPMGGAEPPHEKIPSILPAPSPPVREELPPAPEITQKRGIPMAPVVGAIAIALAIGGVLLFFALKSGPPITAQGRVDERGKEALAVRCVSCPDGTKLSLEGSAASSEVKAGEALLPLASPLALGPNDFAVAVDRPGSGRDETVKLRVPVSYRVRADLGTLSADPPAITVQIEAIAGTTVELEGKPVSLEAGKARVELPIGAEAVGASDTSKSVERNLSFKVTLPNAERTEVGTLPVRARIVPLHVDAPGANAIVESTTCHVTGQTLVGGKITVNGKETPLGTRGEFATDVPCEAAGRHKLELVAQAAGLASRKVTLTVTRVASLEAEAKVWETRGPFHDSLGDNASETAPLPFDALTKPTSVGKPTVVEGPIVDVRSVNGLAVVLLDNRRKCKTDCFVRLLYGGSEVLQKGQTARAFGFVTGVVTADGRTVPEIGASFILPGKPK